ncbi:MAG: methionine synthase / methylenetetrahydrofolate reductase [Pseudonocardiales bacterium]|nr:methionine synthase / methylenetetrahydrofolate reductase [Pseudonocardiales bacterium]
MSPATNPATNPAEGPAAQAEPTPNPVADLAAALGSTVLVCDGAMGTMLHAAGRSLGEALPALNLSDPALVREIHDRYVNAGADIIQTNTFGASRVRLSDHDLGHRTEEINQAGARIALASARHEYIRRPVLVAGSVSPAVSVRRHRHVERRAAVESVREQIEVLASAGVDLIILETFGDLEELLAVIEAAAEATSVPLIAQLTFGPDFRTLGSGQSPREAAAALAGAPIAALGTNCTIGPQHSLAVLRELRSHCDLPLTVQPNAGLPRRVAPARFEYDLDDTYFARYMRQALAVGATVVGGCCGTTPGQIAAVARTVREYRDRAAPATSAPRRAEPAGEAITVGHGEPEHQVVVELTPDPLGDVEGLVDVATQLHESGIGLVSVARPLQTRAQVNAVDLAVHLHHRVGLDVLAAVTTWDRTIMALQADLLGAHALGMRRIICETGSPPLVGDYPHTDGIWDVDSIGLIELLSSLNEGTDYYRLPLSTKTSFEIGARINPGSHEPERAEARARDKIAAGAQFLITRPVYELTGVRRMLDAIGDSVPVLVAVSPLTSFQEAEYLAYEVPDVTIPTATLDALRRARSGAATAGLELAAELVAEVRALAKGVVLAPTSDTVAVVRRLLSH